MSLQNKRIVILGGSSGIGLATAQAVAREGARLVIASSRQTSVDRALATLPAGSEGHVLDLSDEAAVRALFVLLGPFDHLVYTAGENIRLGLLSATDIAAAERFWRIRYWGAFMAAKYGSPNLNENGSITLTSGLAEGCAGAASPCWPRSWRREILPARGKSWG